MKISDKTMKVIHERAEEAMRRLAQGENCLQVAADMYCEYLPDKTEAVSAMMARHLNELVEQYERGCAAAVEDYMGWLDGELEKLLEGKDADARRAVLVQMIQGLAAINGVDVPQMPAEASKEAEDALIRQLYEMMGQCALDKATLDAMTGALDAVGTSEDVAASIVMAREQTHDARVVLSMVAYLNAKNGAFEELRPSMTMDEIALAVCAAIDARQAAQQVASGEISAERGARVLRAIGRVVGYMLAFLFAVVGAVSLIALCSLGQPVLTVLAFAAVYSLVWDETKDGFADFGRRMGEGAWKLAKARAAHIRAGVEKLKRALGSERVSHTLSQEAAADA